jgi:hypothetical protein
MTCSPCQSLNADCDSSATNEYQLGAPSQYPEFDLAFIETSCFGRMSSLSPAGNVSDSQICCVVCEIVPRAFFFSVRGPLRSPDVGPTKFTPMNHTLSQSTLSRLLFTQSIVKLAWDIVRQTWCPNPSGATRTRSGDTSLRPQPTDESQQTTSLGRFGTNRTQFVDHPRWRPEKAYVVPVHLLQSL